MAAALDWTDTAIQWMTAVTNRTSRATARVNKSFYRKGTKIRTVSKLGYVYTRDAGKGILATFLNQNKLPGHLAVFRCKGRYT
jgi:hypothetical protein